MIYATISSPSPFLFYWTTLATVDATTPATSRLRPPHSAPISTFYLPRQSPRSSICCPSLPTARSPSTIILFDDARRPYFPIFDNNTRRPYVRQHEPRRLTTSSSTTLCHQQCGQPLDQPHSALLLHLIGRMMNAPTTHQVRGIVMMMVSQQPLLLRRGRRRGKWGIILILSLLPPSLIQLPFLLPPFRNHHPIPQRHPLLPPLLLMQQH